MSAAPAIDDNPATQLRSRVNAALLPYLPAIAGGFAGFYGAFAIMHLRELPPDIAAVMVPLSAVMALCGAIMMALLSGQNPPAFLQRNLLAIACVGVVVNSAVHLAVTQQLVQSMNIAILMTVMSLFLLRWRELAALLAIAIGTFAATAAGSNDPLVLQFSAHMGEAVIASVMLFMLKQRVSLSLLRTADDLRDALTKAEQLSKDREHHMNVALEAAAAKTRFLATMSHELRTPLNAVIGFSHFLKDDVWISENPDKAAEYARDIAGSGEFLLGLINDILDYAKAAEGKATLVRDRVDAQELAHTALASVRPLAETKAISITADGFEQLPLLMADEIKLKQVFVNLLSNAVKFTPQGGEVRLSALLTHRGISFSVTDNGIGISPNDMTRVFEPFVQADSTLSRVHSGTGLGLPLVKAITELHGGRVVLDSEPGKGTIVSLHFPETLLAPPQAAARTVA